MADDREVLREIWDGKVPICFLLAAEDGFTMEEPEPYYLLVPRQSYFPLVTDKVVKHFKQYLDPENQGEMWLEENGVPLKWHYPIGVLFDVSGTDASLPWTLTVHFSNFPESDLIHCANREVIESHFMSMVKEADSLKHRGQIINAMQKKDHKQLWLGLQNDKFDQFWSVNRKLMEHTGEELFKHMPYRLHQPDKQFMQTLYRPVSESGELHSLGDLIKHIIPDAYPVSDHPDHKIYRVIVQGIEPPLSTPLQWLCEHFSHPDNFLHICILPKK